VRFSAIQQRLGELTDLLASPEVASVLRASGVLLAGILLTRLVRRRLQLHSSISHHGTLIGRGVSYAILLVAVAWALRELGFELATLLGAAGVVTVALGFAAQTSVSNIISGLFLLGERSFKVGDIITLAETTGVVLSVDLLSIKVRTYDNLMVRIPNENVLKSNVTNLTRFPIRRVDLKIGIAYKESLARVREVLLDVAKRNPLCLEEPKPLLVHRGFGESSVDLQFSVWGDRVNFLELRSSMYELIKTAFDEHGVEIPFPHRTLYAGAETEPLPVQLVSAAAQPPR
jgi:small-conductance mechanosensitive channel